jgi:hypothetical protein
MTAQAQPLVSLYIQYRKAYTLLLSFSKWLIVSHLMIFNILGILKHSANFNLSRDFVFLDSC